MKRVKYILFIIVCVLVSETVVWAASDGDKLSAAGQSQSNHHALLWRISQDGQTESYLLGTVHSEDPRVLALVEHITGKISQTNCLALELDLNPLNAAKVMQAMFFTDGRALQHFLTKETYSRLITIMSSKLGLGVPQINSMKPWAVMMLLSAPMPESGYFLDKALYLFAIENNIRVVGLETPEEQVAVMDNMSIADQVALMETALDSYENMPEMFERLIQAYLTQNLSAMESLYDKFTRDNDAALVEVLTERLLNARNALMATRMVSLFEEQACFCAVGALHLPGEQGLLSRLRKLGYRVEPVDLVF